MTAHEIAQILQRLAAIEQKAEDRFASLREDLGEVKGLCRSTNGRVSKLELEQARERGAAEARERQHARSLERASGSGERTARRIAVAALFLSLAVAIANFFGAHI